MSIFQPLYDSEINFVVSCFWDNGFEVKLGDDLNGFVAETVVESWDEIEPWLTMQALLHSGERLRAEDTLVTGAARRNLTHCSCHGATIAERQKTKPRSA
jgi:hypothetical protein